MSRFRTLVESFIKKVYVEGLPLEESYYDVLCESVNKEINNLRKEIKEKLEALPQFKGHIHIIPKRVSANEVVGYNTMGNSYYAYVQINCGSSFIDSKCAEKLLQEFNKDIPVSVAYRISTHRTEKVADLDVLIPDPDKYKEHSYARRAVGTVYKADGQVIHDPYVYIFNENNNNLYIKTAVDTITEKLNKLIKMYDEKGYPNEKSLGIIVNNFLRFLYENYQNLEILLLNKTATAEEQLAKYKNNSKVGALYEAYIYKPQLKDWVIALLDNIKGNEALLADIEERNNLIKRVKEKDLISKIRNLSTDIEPIKASLAPQEEPEQDKAPLFKQATKNTLTLDKFNKTQQDHDDIVTTDPAQKR